MRQIPVYIKSLIQKREQERRSAAFSKVHPEAEGRGKLQCLHQDPVSRLRAQMPRYQILSHRTSQPYGDVGRECGDESVDDRRNPFCGASEKQPGHSGDVQSADLRKNIENVPPVRTVDAQRVPDHLCLVPVCRTPSFVRPAPGPAISSGSLSKKAQTQAALVVVLPIPISPGIRI